MKNITVLFVCMFFYSFAFAQEQGEQKFTVGLHLLANSTAAVEIIPDYEALSTRSLTSARSAGYEAQFYLAYKLMPKVEMQLGLIAGVHSSNFIMRIDSSFLALYSETFDDYFLVYDDWYSGWDLRVNYVIWERKRNSFGCTAGIRSLFFFPTGGNSAGLSASLPDGTSKDIFDLSTSANPKEKITFAPEVGLSFTRRFYSRLKLGLHVEASYSKDLILVSHKPYTLYGDDEVLHGNFKKKYQQVGVGLDFGYMF